MAQRCMFGIKASSRCVFHYVAIGRATAPCERGTEYLPALEFNSTQQVKKKIEAGEVRCHDSSPAEAIDDLI
jgi:hypothetical protein